MKEKLTNITISKMYMLVLLGISVLMIGSYFSYAMFTVSKEKSNAISIVTGNLTGLLKVDGVEANTLEVPAGATTIFTVELSNPNAIKAKFNFYYTGVIDSTVEAGYIINGNSNTPPKETGIILEPVGSMGSSQMYKIRVTNNGTSNISIPIGYSVSLENSTLSLPSGANLFSRLSTGTLIKANAPESNDFHVYDYSSKTTSIVTKDNSIIPETAIASWDISEAGDGKAVAYIEENGLIEYDNGTSDSAYKLTLGGEGGLLANTDMSSYFANFTEAKIIDLTYLDTMIVTNMDSMFLYCRSLTSLNLSGFDTSKVTSMDAMFCDCSSITSLNVSSFDTSNVTTMNHMFVGCSNLTELDISDFNISSLETACMIFYDCPAGESAPSWINDDKYQCEV